MTCVRSRENSCPLILLKVCAGTAEIERSKRATEKSVVPPVSMLAGCEFGEVSSCVQCHSMKYSLSASVGWIRKWRFPRTTDTRLWRS